MANILDDLVVNEVVEVGEVGASVKPEKKLARKGKSADIEEKREQLSILVVQGSIEPYAGREMSLGVLPSFLPRKLRKYITGTRHRWQQ